MGVIKNYMNKNLASRFSLPTKRMAGRLYRFEKIVENADIVGKRVLEIGSGTGIFSCLLAMNGAKSVTSLEPELGGHSNGAFEQFHSNIAEFDLQNISLVKQTFQDFQAPDNSFDMIFSIASVNHLDEEMCKVLHRDPKAKQTYRGLFTKLYNLLDKNGKIVIVDCARKNLFAWPAKHLSIKNPIARGIEWEKHQQPSMWAKLLIEAGFEKSNYRWLFPKSIHGIEKLLNNTFMAYMTTSFFVLSGEK